MVMLLRGQTMHEWVLHCERNSMLNDRVDKAYQTLNAAICMYVCTCMYVYLLTVISQLQKLIHFS